MSECIEHTGYRNRDGYGCRNGRQFGTILAHRQVWITEHGSIPQGMCVLHHCDNPACINVDHLFLGTDADNVADMQAKGRDNFYGHRGRKNQVPFTLDDQDEKVDPQDIPVQLNIRVPWHYREQLVRMAREKGVSLNRLATNALVRSIPPDRQ